MDIKVLYDPLYGAIPFKLRTKDFDTFIYDTIPDMNVSEGAATLIQYGQRFSLILKTFEFRRLNFLRQSGFAWLIYPSATHTRYAHSLGCWYLAELAAEYTKVRWINTQKGREIFLINFLEERDLLEEFLLSLLLHDIGHFPFSHILESNPRYKNTSHEKLGIQLIRGEGEFFELFKKFALQNFEDRTSVPDALFLSQALREYEKVDLDIICTLISKDLSYIKDKPGNIQEAIPVMLELVSGLIDLDRVDHYHRDARFMGLGVATVNPVALLANMLLVYTGSVEPGSCAIHLSDDATMQVFNLLESRETLRGFIFNNEENVAYSAMLNTALDILLKDNLHLEKEILIWTDDYLLNRLASCDNPLVLKLAKRIQNAAPYYFIVRHFVPKRNRNLEWIGDLKEKQFIPFLNEKEGLNVDEADILIYTPKGFFADRRIPSDNWLKFDELYDFQGEILKRSHQFMRRINYLQDLTKEEEEMSSEVQIFAANPSLQRALQLYVKTHEEEVFG